MSVYRHDDEKGFLGGAVIPQANPPSSAPQPRAGMRRGSLALLPLLVIVLALAFFTGIESLFYLLYLLAGLVLVSYLWLRQAPMGVDAVRHFPSHAFHGEAVMAELVVTNKGRLPILWMELQESIPLSLHSPSFERRVVSLAPGEKERIEYRLGCHRRGYYHLGPLILRLGDIFDIIPERELEGSEDEFIVYPRVVPLARLGLPSRLPYGDLPSRQRIFEDPSRFAGVREYQPGDSTRLIHWKSSGRTDHLLVKRFQPAIALNTLVILNLNIEDYSLRARADAGERGIVVAASVAAHIIDKRERVGLAVLGLDAVSKQIGLQSAAPMRGREHLIRVLELLARAELGSAAPFAPILSQATSDLGWGSSVVVVTPGSSENLVDALLGLRRRGLHALLVATDPQGDFENLRVNMQRIGVPAFLVRGEKDMDLWR